MLALRQLINDTGNNIAMFKQLANVPPAQVSNFRNDMYLASEAFRTMKKIGKPTLAAADWAVLDNYKNHIDKATKFIPTWVKVAVALALDSAQWWAGSVSWSPLARRSARII